MYIWTWNLPDNIRRKASTPLHSPSTTKGSWLQKQQYQSNYNNKLYNTSSLGASQRRQEEIEEDIDVDIEQLHNESGVERPVHSVPAK